MSLGPLTRAWSSLAVQVVVLAAVLWAANTIGNGDRIAFAYSVIAALLGIVSGWLVGALASPREEGTLGTKEQAEFSTFRSALGAFASGYLLSKVDVVFGRFFAESGPPTAIYVARIAIFLICFVLGAIGIYIYRRYLFELKAA
jgi:hypothetical protein